MARPNHIEDALCRIHKGAWWTWTDKNNKIYSNLKLTAITQDANVLPVSNPYSIPSEADVNAKLKEIQDAWDLENDSYKSKRKAAYNTIVDQLDALYKDLVAGKLDTTGTWATHIKSVKDANPKS